ncbi:MAG: 30S ribosomal protein S17 [Candidatus Bathyarchaeota archaeon]|nr:30S ribosomal protein S17 [Candidatus Bathyarchaeota archaeon]
MQSIGISVKPPKKGCKDKNCPFHGTLPVRKSIFNGVVVSNRMRDTVVVRRDYHRYVSKYKRYERRHSSIPAHNPPCINAKKGDNVKLAECRPLSKSVSFVVIEKMEG